MIYVYVVLEILAFGFLCLVAGVVLYVAKWIELLEEEG